MSRWVITPGTEFSVGDVLCEIDSELAVIEYRAQSNGFFAKALTEQGTAIVPGQVLGVQVEAQEYLSKVEEWLSKLDPKQLKPAAAPKSE